MRQNLLFEIRNGSKWIGGVYYFRSIIRQLFLLDGFAEKWNVIVLADDNLEGVFEGIHKQVRVISIRNSNSTITKLKKVFWFLRADSFYHFQRDGELKGLLDQKAVYWIPDLQELFYPEYFSEYELADRDARNRRIAASPKPLIFSSEDSKKSFLEHYPVCEGKPIRVVHFVSTIDDWVKDLSRTDIRKVVEKYELHKPYFFIANQFWKHKNHKLVFEAIRLAQNKGILSEYDFVFTGLMEDRRNPEYTKQLMNIVDSLPNQEQIKVLGFISRTDQLALMAGAQLLIQPSLFEGWGTVVEDGKVLDKTMLISDIPVHHEQMNEKCVLFDPASPEDLLDKLQLSLRDLKQDDRQAGLDGMHKQMAEYAMGLRDIFL